METTDQLQRYQDQFIDIERKHIEHLLENFYELKLSRNYIQRDIFGLTAIISDIFITWDDYQQFMDDHPKDFCWVLKGVTLI